MVLSDVSETMPRRGEVFGVNKSHLVFIVIFLNVFVFPEWLQMPLHGGVPPEAAAAGLGGPEQVHGLLLRVGSHMGLKYNNNTTTITNNRRRSSFVFTCLPSEFKRDFIELLSRRFGEFLMPRRLS